MQQSLRSESINDGSDAPTVTDGAAAEDENEEDETTDVIEEEEEEGGKKVVASPPPSGGPRPRGPRGALPRGAAPVRSNVRYGWWCCSCAILLGVEARAATPGIYVCCSCAREQQRHACVASLPRSLTLYALASFLSPLSLPLSSSLSAVRHRPLTRRRHLLGNHRVESRAGRRTHRLRSKRSPPPSWPGKVGKTRWKVMVQQRSAS